MGSPSPRGNSGLKHSSEDANLVPLSSNSQISFKPRRNQCTKRRKTQHSFQPSAELTTPAPFEPKLPQNLSSISGNPCPPKQATARPRASRSRWDSRLQHSSPGEHDSPVKQRYSSVTDVGTPPLVSRHTIEKTDNDEVDRVWYLGNEAGNASVQSLETDDTLLARRQARNLSARAAANLADSARWESKQLSSGLHSALRGTSEEFVGVPSDDAAPRVALLVNELTPPFLTSATSTLKEDDTIDDFGRNAVIGDHVVWPVKDPTSDMAVIARNGSATLTSFQENRERGKPRVKYWDLGSFSGAKALENAQADEERSAKFTSFQTRDENWKKDMQYSAVMGKKNENKSKLPSDHLDDLSLRSLSEVRRSLPVYSVKRKLMNLIHEHQVCVVVGETGSGKTTQLAQYLEEEGYSQFGVIGCTQPRRVAAVSVAQRVAEEFNGGCNIGQEVGYTIRFEDCSSDKTVIKFMTDGILMRESLSDPDLDRYSVIIMDEAHERSLNTDVLFGILRGVVAKRRDLKVIITSATLNAEKFSSFFGNAPVFTIPGRTFPVEIFYSRNPVEDYVQGAVWQALQLHIQAPIPGDILIFMTGQDDIEATCETLAEEIGKRQNPRPILILPLYSQLATDLQAKIFEPAPEGTRKVIVATNIAETSLTIDGIKFVIDSGFCKLKTYNPKLGIDALLLCPASQSSVNQRSGRAGRTGPGKCYRLFTGSSFSTELLETNVPEIQRTNLGHVVLLLKTHGVRNLLEFPFLDSPPAGNILKSMHGLWLLRALNIDGELTDLGKRMAVFPLDPALSALLFIGDRTGCLVETVTIVAMLSVPNAFVRPHGREEESDSAREKFFVPESDHLTLLHVYQRWRAAGCRPDWCAKNYVSSKSMRKAREVREQLLEIARSEKMAESNCDNWDLIRKAVGTAFFYQAARRKGIGEYINVRSGVVCGLHPTSAMYGSGLTPDYVVYHELIMTKKEYMSCVTAVEPQWLAEAGPMLYLLKQAGDEDLKLTHMLRESRAKVEDDLRRRREHS